MLITLKALSLDFWFCITRATLGRGNTFKSGKMCLNIVPFLKCDLCYAFFIVYWINLMILFAAENKEILSLFSVTHRHPSICTSFPSFCFQKFLEATSLWCPVQTLFTCPQLKLKRNRRYLKGAEKTIKWGISFVFFHNK